MRRAVIETVAENLADGVVAPMFFILILGLPGLFFYKAANTMDSMVGYKNYWYAQFGKVAARADDVLNFIPARLTALLMIPTAAALGLNWREAWRILWRDRTNAASPNAGWPEAAMAGALGVRLGGPSIYFGRLVDKPFIGEAQPTPGPGALSPGHSPACTAPRWPWPPSPWWVSWPAGPGSGACCLWSDKSCRGRARMNYREVLTRVTSGL